MDLVLYARRLPFCKKHIASGLQRHRSILGKSANIKGIQQELIYIRGASFLRLHEECTGAF
jgi:hypothetical protein